MTSIANTFGKIGAPTTPMSATLADAVDSTGAQSAVRLPRGLKSFSAVVTGIGAVSATVDIEISNDGTNFEAASGGTLTLSGTTKAQASVSSEESWLYHRANVTSISGTGAAVTVVVGV